MPEVFPVKSNIIFQFYKRSSIKTVEADPRDLALFQFYKRSSGRNDNLKKLAEESNFQFYKRSSSFTTQINVGAITTILFQFYKRSSL